MNFFCRRYPLKGQSSLLFLASLSACFFAAMIVARKTLSPDDLYFWNALVTLVTIGYTFCFFGAEQLFIRFSTVTDGSVAINRGTLQLMGVALLLFTALLALLSEGYFFRLNMVALYPALGVCVGIFVFVYNMMRVRKSFNLAQLAANGWKFTILGALLLAPLENVPWVLTSVGLGLPCVGTLALFWLNRKMLNVTADPMPDQWVSLFFGFLFSLFVLLLLNNTDRLIMTRYGSNAQFSEHVYLVTLLLMPFSLLSNYFGFKEMAYLKQSYDRRRFLRKTIGLGGLAACLFVPWFGLIYAFQGLLEVSVFLSYGLPTLAIVTCRCSYALLSTLFGLQGTPRQILVANLLTLLAIGTGIAVLLAVGVTIINVLVFMAACWCVRVAIYAWYTACISDYEGRDAL